MRTRPRIIFSSVCLISASSTSVFAGEPIVLLKTGQRLAGSDPNTEVVAFRGLEAVGPASFAVLLETKESDVFWGRTGEMTSPDELLRPLQGQPSVLGYEQTRFENRFGLHPSGTIVYSTGVSPRALPSGETTLLQGWLDSVWRYSPDTGQAQQLLARRLFPAGAPGSAGWVFASKPGITRTGMPHWYGGVDSNPLDTGSSRSIFRLTTTGSGSVVEEILSVGQSVAMPVGSPRAITAIRDSVLGPDGSDFVARVRLAGDEASDDALLVSDFETGQEEPLTLVEGALVDAATSATERWKSFGPIQMRQQTPCHDSYRWLALATTTNADTSNSVIVADGQVVVREGDSQGGLTLVGDVESATLSDVGDIVFVTHAGQPGQTAPLGVFFNDTRIAHVGQQLSTGGAISHIYPFVRAGAPKADRQVDVYFIGEWQSHTGSTADAVFVVSVAGSIGLCPCLADIAAVGGTEEEPGEPDGQLTIDDIIVFVNSYSNSTGCPGTPGVACNPADITEIGGTVEAPGLPDGQLTLDDIIVFINAYSNGC